MNRATRRSMQREGTVCEHGHPKKTDGTGTPVCPHGCGFPAYLPGRARRAAEALVETYCALGSKPEDYDKVWQAKEYLLDSADHIQFGGA